MKNLSQKLKSSVVDGIIYFSFSSKGVKFEIIFDSKKDLKCDGKLFIEISPGIKSKQGEEPSTITKELYKAFHVILNEGPIAAGTIILYKFYKDAGAVGGPVGNLIGFSS